MMFKRSIRKVQNFAHRPLFEQAWFLPAWLLLGASRLLILFIPFRSLAAHLGIHTGSLPWGPLVDAREEAIARRIARVVQMTAKYTPWQSNCFPQAITARVLLGLYGIPYALYFGVSRKSEDVGMQAHAWVISGRVQVCGGESFTHFTVVGCFVSPRLAQYEDRSE
jgi:hypothetical protein